jgi:hypothetical protein
MPSDKGKIMIALYDSKKNYMDIDKAVFVAPSSDFIIANTPLLFH